MAPCRTLVSRRADSGWHAATPAETSSPCARQALLELVWGTQVSFQPPSHGCHGPSDCHADESRGLGGLGAVPWPWASRCVACRLLCGVSPVVATSFLAPEPTPSPARSHLFSGPTYSFLSTFLPQHLLPCPSLRLSAAQVSLVRDPHLVSRPTPDLATSPSCHHPTVQNPPKLASPTCISDRLGFLLLSK